MNKVERVDTDQFAAAAPALAPPQRLEQGSIVTLRMRGHQRTAGQEYFAAAVVLDQHMPNGEIEVLIWDPTAGTHYNNSYPIREVSSRGEGPEREMYEVQSNIGTILFSPEAFAQQGLRIGALLDMVETLNDRVYKLESALT